MTMSKGTGKIIDFRSLQSGEGRRPVSEQVVRKVLDLIRTGDLTAGRRLPTERELAVQFAISRPTVREALRALSILGVLEIRQGDGVYVSSLEATRLLKPLDFFVSLSAANTSQLFDARIVYEPMTAGLAAERLSDEAVERLAEIVVAQQVAPEDAELFHDTDMEFHKILMDGSENVFLARFGKILQLLGDQGRRALQRRQDMRQQSIRDHEVILGAVRARDADGAALAMRRHMVNVRNALGEMTDA